MDVIESSSVEGLLARKMQFDLAETIKPKKISITTAAERVGKKCVPSNRVPFQYELRIEVGWNPLHVLK